MAFGFPAYHTEHYSAGADASADLRVAIRAAIKALSWTIKQEVSDQIIASTNFNLRSSWEKVSISFLPDNSISITSKCSWPTQCFDWGKNKANVEKFMAEIKKQA
jgi:hypothetical protein